MYRNRISLREKSESNILEDLNIASLLKAIKHLQAAADASVLRNEFRKRYIGHTKRNIIDLDSEETETESEIDLYAEKLEPMNFNLLQNVLFR